ncbi:MAG: permease, partial [Planctomycetota bacterium]
MNIDQMMTFISSPQATDMLEESAKMFLQLFLELTFLFLIISYLVAVINQKLSAEKIQRILGSQGGRGYFT